MYYLCIVYMHIATCIISQLHHRYIIYGCTMSWYCLISNTSAEPAVVLHYIAIHHDHCIAHTWMKIQIVCVNHKQKAI